jgi:hypothetical protein
MPKHVHTCECAKRTAYDRDGKKTSLRDPVSLMFGPDFIRTHEVKPDKVYQNNIDDKQLRFLHPLGLSALSY